MKTASLLVLALALTAGCKQEGGQQAAPSTSQSAAPAAAPSASAAAVQKPWYEGQWTGSYAAERFLIELPIGAVASWAKDDGSKASGPGEVKLSVDADGLVSGSATGALGSHAVRGRVIEDSLRLELVPAEASTEALRGAGLTQREGESLKGELRASSGDSLTVRKASLTLTKQPGG
jgi:hypothetical protein